MRLGFKMLVVVVLALGGLGLFGCDSSTDADAGGIDAGSPPMEDSGPPPTPDSGPPPSPDSGPPPMPDAGPPPGDDAGTPMPDAGVRPVDAGRPRDAGVPPRDAGPPVDGGDCSDDGSDDVLTGATNLGMFEDRTAYPAGTTGVTIFGGADLDWFTYHVEDTISFSNLEPRADLDGLPGDVRYELCIYYECDTTTERVDCMAGTAHELSASRHGCCAVGLGPSLQVKFAPFCATSDESGQVYVRVGQQGGAPICTEYSLRYGDD